MLAHPHLHRHGVTSRSSSCDRNSLASGMPFSNIQVASARSERDRGRFADEALIAGVAYPKAAVGERRLVAGCVFSASEQADDLAIEPRAAAMRSIPVCRSWRPSLRARPGGDIGFDGLSERKPAFAVGSGGRLRPIPSGLSSCRAVAGTGRSALYGLCVKPQPFIAAATSVTATLATELRCRGASRQDPRQSAIVVALP
jgi:hypothetical protein